MALAKEVGAGPLRAIAVSVKATGVNSETAVPNTKKVARQATFFGTSLYDHSLFV